MAHRPKIIGLMGGVASGKTTAAGMFGQLGAVVVDADRIAHDVLNEAGAAGQVRREWGEGVMDPSGSVDRRKLGDRVFQDPAETQ